MKEKIKGLRLNITISAIISIVIGALLIAYPTEVTIAISRIIAAIVIFAGLAIVGSQFFENNKNIMGMIVGGIIIVLGIWLMLKPEGNFILNLIPIIIGVILVFHGVQDIGMAIEVVKAKGNRAWLLFIFAILNIAVGAVCILMAFQIVKTIFWLIGIMLIYDGVTDIFMVHKVRKTTKVVVDSTIIDEEDM